MLSQKEAAEKLKDLIQADPTIYYYYRRSTPSGMSRDYAIFAVIRGEIRDITRLVAAVTGKKANEQKNNWYIRLNYASLDPFNDSISKAIGLTVTGRVM